MRCPNCNAENSVRVTHSTRAPKYRRRRYRCRSCRRNFYTRVYEIAEASLSENDAADLARKAERPATR